MATMKLAHLTAALASALALAPSRDVGAQPPIAVLRSAADNQPIPYGTVVVGNDTPGRFADAIGRFMLVPGSHRIRASNIGFWPLDTIVTAGGTSPIALRLQPMVVAARRDRSDLDRCTPMASRDAAPRPELVLLRENVD